MKGIFKLLVTIGVPGEVNEIRQTDAIEYVSDVWLVPEWIKQSSTGLQKPARIIRVGHILDPGRSAARRLRSGAGQADSVHSSWKPAGHRPRRT